MGMEPPRTICCTLCDGRPQQTFRNGWIAWDYKIEHVTCHMFPYKYSRSTFMEYLIRPPDFNIFRWLWRNRLIDDLELEELTIASIGNDCFTMSPFDQTQEKRRIWCTECPAQFERPILPSLDTFRVESDEGIEDSRATEQADVFEFIRKHNEQSEKAYEDWVSSHSHQYPAVVAESLSNPTGQSSSALATNGKSSGLFKCHRPSMYVS